MWMIITVVILMIIIYIIQLTPKWVWDHPYYRLPWKYRWYVQPVIFVIRAINYVLLKIRAILQRWGGKQ